jgi:hypothetical protein
MVNSYGTQLNASNKNGLTFVVVIADRTDSISLTLIQVR